MAWNSDAAFISQIEYQLEFRSHVDFMSCDLTHLGSLLLDRPQNMGIEVMGLYMTDTEVAEMQRRDALGDKMELIVEAVTGARESEMPEGELPDYGSNFGGIWMDQLEGGQIVLAVVDASLLDLQQLYEIVGGPENLKIIEQPFTYNEIETYRLMLANELRALGIPSDIAAVRNDQGRLLEVRVQDPGSLPDNFGAGVPDGAFSIVQGEPAQPESG